MVLRPEIGIDRLPADLRLPVLPDQPHDAFRTCDPALAAFFPVARVHLREQDVARFSDLPGEAVGGEVLGHLPASGDVAEIVVDRRLTEIAQQRALGPDGGLAAQMVDQLGVLLRLARRLRVARLDHPALLFDVEHHQPAGRRGRRDLRRGRLDLRARQVQRLVVARHRAAEDGGLGDERHLLDPAGLQLLRRRRLGRHPVRPAHLPEDLELGRRRLLMAGKRRRAGQQPKTQHADADQHAHIPPPMLREAQRVCTAEVPYRAGIRIISLNMLSPAGRPGPMRMPSMPDPIFANLHERTRATMPSVCTNEPEPRSHAFLHERTRAQPGSSFCTNEPKPRSRAFCTNEPGRNPPASAPAAFPPPP